jgi:hypothetical protein
MNDEDSAYSDDDIQDNPKGLTNIGGHDFGNLSLHDDTDEVVQYALASARTDVDYAENPPRFADLYYSSLQENLDRAAEQYADNAVDNSVSQMIQSDGAPGRGNNFASRVHEKTLMRHPERYAGDTTADAALSDELDTIHQVPYFHHHPSSYTQSETRTTGHSDPTCASCGHHVAPATAKSAIPIPPSKSQLGPRSFQSTENPCIHKQNSCVNASVAYDNPITTASRSRSVKDKVRELEERVERANIDT